MVDWFHFPVLLVFCVSSRAPQISAVFVKPQAASQWGLVVVWVYLCLG